MNVREMQNAAYQNKVNKGFNITNVEMEFCLLYGEVSEAYDAYKKKKDDLSYELADVAIYLLGLSEILGVDLENAIKEKMTINAKRVYIDDKGTKLKTEE